MAQAPATRPPTRPAVASTVQRLSANQMRSPLLIGDKYWVLPYGANNFDVFKASASGSYQPIGDNVSDWKLFGLALLQECHADMFTSAAITNSGGAIARTTPTVANRPTSSTARPHTAATKKVNVSAAST